MLMDVFEDCPGQRVHGFNSTTESRTDSRPRLSGGAKLLDPSLAHRDQLRRYFAHPVDSAVCRIAVLGRVGPLRSVCIREIVAKSTV